MTHIRTTLWKSMMAMIAVTGSLVAAGAAQAGHVGPQPCNPAAEVHMQTAIRLMETACGKPIQVSQGLARAAIVHVSLAQRFVRTPGAQAQLCGAKTTLERFVSSHCAPPFHGAIEQTRLALALERNPCVCGRPACTGGCHVPPPQPRLDVGIHAPPLHGQARGFEDRYGRGGFERDFRQPASRYPQARSDLAGWRR